METIFPYVEIAPIYTKLANGEHDLTGKELRIFSRDTGAWIDGVYYEPHKPRYRDGKLLIEEQATNLYIADTMTLSIATDGYTVDEYIIENFKLSTVTENGQPQKYASNILCYGVNITNSAIDDIRYVTVVYEKNVNIIEFRDLTSDARCVSPSFYVINGEPDLSRKNGNSEVIDFRYFNETFILVRIKLTVISLTNNATFLSARFANQEIKPSSLTMGIVQVSEILSEYIPTTNSTVTRSADIAYVEDIA